MASGSEHVSPGLSDYLAGHSTPPDALLRDLTAETAERFPDRVRMQIGPQQGTFLTMLAGLMGARHAVEVGTFTGYSSICLARGMATDVHSSLRSQQMSLPSAAIPRARQIDE